MVIAAPQGELVLAKGDPAAGSVDTCFMMSSQYDLLATGNTAMEGRNSRSFEPYDDAPKEGSFDWSGLAFAAIGILAAVAVVGVLSLTGVGALVVGGLVAGAVAGGLGAAKAAHESGLEGTDFLKAVGLGALTGGIKGAAAGLVIALAPYAAEALVAGYLPVGLMVGSTYLSTAALTTLASGGLSSLAFIYAGFKANEVMAFGSGTNYLQALTGMSNDTYDILSNASSASAAFIAGVGLFNLRFWSDLKNNQNLMGDVLAQGKRGIQGLYQSQHQSYTEINIHGRLNSELDEVDS